MNEKIIDKIKKLLALAENNTNESESQNAMLKAQKLMAKHKIAEGDIQTGQEKEVIHLKVTPVQRTIWWKKSLANVIGENFKCYVYYTHYQGSGSCINFLGLKEDAEIAKEILNFSIEACQYHAENFMREARKKYRYTKGLRNDFIIGFVSGLKKRFEKQVEQEELALVLVKDSEVVESYKKMNLKTAQASRVQQQKNAEAYQNGFKRGKNFNHNKRLASSI